MNQSQKLETTARWKSGSCGEFLLCLAADSRVQFVLQKLQNWQVCFQVNDLFLCCVPTSYLQVKVVKSFCWYTVEVDLWKVSYHLMPTERRVGECFCFFGFMCLWGWWLNLGFFFGFCYISGLNYMAACLVFCLLELLGIFHQLFLKNTPRHHWNSIFVFC